ncbi:AAA family ATPase [Streptomyces sp. NBC_01537]|uniref:helix-turn-helix transcriptional regulator n=1 Tax=Streptomyces sp. NBC_01537 TaxID=2903896 RepID=UPI0038646A19
MTALEAPESAGRYDVPLLVSRTRELEALDSVLNGLGEGGPTIVDVSGEAGIGKSRLLSEFRARIIRDHGITVLSGRASEYEQHIPFRPFCDAFADLDPRALRADAELARAVAPIVNGWSGPDPRDGNGNAVDRFALYQATASLLRQLGETGLVVLILDDLHWADPASLELVDYLIRHPVRSSVVLIVSHRGRQTPRALTAALTRGADSGSVLHVGLGPLSRKDCVEKLAPGLDRRHAEEFHSASEGNPLYFLAMVHAHRSGVRSSSAYRTDVLTDPSGLPPGLLALLLAELDPLGPVERRLLATCAVLGEHATPGMLQAVSEQSAQDVADGLQELLRRDLVRPEGKGRGVVLRHPVVRALVYESINPSERAQSHHRAAAALASVGAPVAERANHVARSLPGGWDEEAAAVLVEAAELVALTAPAASAYWLEVVLGLMPSSPVHADARNELTLRRARVLSVAGELHKSRDLLHELIADSGAEDERLHASAVALCALVERHLGHYQEATALLRRQLGELRRAPTAETVLLGVEMGTTALVAGSYSEARGVVADALTTARALGDRVGEAWALAVAAQGETYEGETRSARALADAASAAADALTDSDLAGSCELLAQLASAEMLLERYADAERHADRGLTIARRGRQLYVTPHLLICKAYVCLMTCRISSSVRFADEAESIARGFASDELLAFVLGLKSLIVMQATAPGDPASVAVAEEAVATAAASDSWFASLAWCMLGSVTNFVRPDRSIQALLRAGGPDLRRLQPSMRPTFLELLTAAAMARGEVGAAAQWAERADCEAVHLDLPTQRAAALQAQALILASAGEPAAAAVKYAEAAEECAKAGATLRQAHSLLLGASLMASAGRIRQGTDMWQRGHGLIAGTGAQLLLALAELVRPAVDAPEPAVPDELAALTPREREIVHLVARGLTSQAVATQLFLSYRTVESHLGNAYRKLGVSSRAALAALVVGAAVRPKSSP